MDFTQGEIHQRFFLPSPPLRLRLNPLHRIDHDITVGACVGNFDVASAAFFETKRANRLKQFLLSGLFLFVQSHLRFAVRMLTRARGFTATALVVLTLGIGATATMGDTATTEQLLLALSLLGLEQINGDKLSYRQVPEVGQCVILYGRSELLKRWSGPALAK